MYAIDFEYDGQYLSDYGFIICEFEKARGLQVKSAGSKVSFNKVSRHGGKKFSIAGAKYDECITTTFDICKNAEEYDMNEMEITNDEYRDIMRWLNRKEFLKFQLLDDQDRDNCYYFASFNIDTLFVSDKLFGMRLTMETDKPFGYGQDQEIKWTFASPNITKLLSDVSDEVGIIYPDVTIKCMRNGDLELLNSDTNCRVMLRNCSVGEIITMKGDIMTIATSYNSHDIVNDFNYQFLKIGNTINNRSNHITASNPCEVTIRYTPIIKDAP